MATAPPTTTQRQQHAFTQLMIGSPTRTPMSAPASSAGWRRGGDGIISVVVLPPEMRDELLAPQIAERVLQLHELNEQVVLRIETRRVHRTLVIEREPFLNPLHPGALGQVQEQRRVQHDRRRQDAVAAEEVDLQLHRVPEPPEDVDVVPALFVVA